jgi:ACT domain-containing protein
MKRVIGVEDIEAVPSGGELVVDANMIVTPVARERASARGVKLRYPKGRAAYEPRIEPPATAGTGPIAAAIAEALDAQASRGSNNRVVITATGVNGPGVVARLSTAVSEVGGDITDITQTIVQNLFTMLIVVDLSRATGRSASFKGFKERVLAEADRLGVHATVIHQDILQAMHRI